MGNTRDVVSKVTTEEMIEALKKSGYLLENRVANVASATNPYMVEKNVTFPDFETGKANELDVIATIFSDSEFSAKLPSFIIRNNLIIEFKNNENPVVFFKGGHEIKVLNGHHGCEYAVNIEKMPQHHSRRMSSARAKFLDAARCTQYCSFIKVKGKEQWIAKHEDDQYSDFRKLARATEYYARRERQTNVLEIDVKYLFRYIWPVIVLQNEMFVLSDEENQISLEPVNHVLFVHEDVIGNTHGPYCIDIVTEEELPRFLSKFISADKFICSWAIDYMRTRAGFKSRWNENNPPVFKR